MSLILDMLKDVDKRLQNPELPPGLVPSARRRFSFSFQLPQRETMVFIAILCTLASTILYLVKHKVSPTATISIPAYTASQKSDANNAVLPDKWSTPVTISSVSFETKKNAFEIRLSLSRDALYELKQTADNRIHLIIDNAKLQADLPTLVGYDMMIKSIQATPLNSNIDLSFELNRDANLLSVNLQQENNNNELIIAIGNGHPDVVAEKTLPIQPVIEDTGAKIKSPAAQSVVIAQYERAVKLAEAGNQQDAVDIFMHLLQTYPDYHDARVAVAAIILNNGNTVEARKIIDEGLALSPDYPPLLEVKSRILTSEGKINEALLLLQSEKPDINEAPAYYTLMAALLNRTEKFEEATKLYQQLVAINPHDSTLWFGLGVAQDKVGNNKEALTAYRKASMEGKLNKPALAFLENRMQILQDESHVES